MKKYNLSEIMKNAWNIRREKRLSMSSALKISWRQAKEPPVSIKGWFMSKNFSDIERLLIVGAKAEVDRETEKALHICWNTRNGKIFKWVPKSCLETPETREEELASLIQARRDREARYENLISECRSHGIPARKGWRVATMRQRLAEVCA